MENTMKNKNNVLMMLLLMMVLISNGGNWVEAQVHHVVGDDRGWDLGSDIASWASDRTFIVGDFLWFAYSGGTAKDNIVEIRSKEEFDKCDVRNPIKMYTNGIDRIPLEKEGVRYFSSSNLDNCKKGLKIPLEVKSSKSTSDNRSSSSSSSLKNANFLMALEPSSPSSSTKICEPVMVIFGAILFTYMLLS